MSRKSAGIIFYRVRNGLLEVLLVHPGGPFWAKKDAGAWSIPKGEFEEQEDPFEAAQREIEEETGVRVSGKARGDFIELTPVRQKGGKWIYAWALQKDIDAEAIRSNFFEIEWPPRSGKKKEFPEIDRAGWFAIPQAGEKINKGQLALLEELEGRIQ